MRKQARPSPFVSSINAATPQVFRNAVFDNCQNFTVTGGTFIIQATKNDVDESDFRRVRLGDLKLVKAVVKQKIVEYREIPHKKTGVVKRRVPEVVGVRRIYLACMHGSQDDFTAVVYEGSDFEKHRAHAEQREELRHPSLLQLFGVTSSTRLKALLYHDSLIPLDEFRKIHEQSPLMSAYVEHEFSRHFYAALDHWDEVTGRWLLVPDSYGFRNTLDTGTMLWTRISTGQLCIEVNDTMQQDPTMLPIGRRDESISQVHLTSDNNLEEKLLSNMSLDDIHTIFTASGWGKPIEIVDPGTILLGSLSWPTSSCTHLFNPFSELSLSDGLGCPDVYAGGWKYADSYMQGSANSTEGPVVLPNGWTRIALADLPIRWECHLRKTIYLKHEAAQEIRKTWLSQANYIMGKSGLDADECYLLTDLALCLSISSNADEFTLQGTFMADSPTDDVYLFLFPADVDDSNGHLAVHLPLETETYYWSLDPEGIEPLPQDGMDELAPPSVSFQAAVDGIWWEKAIYVSIADCHCAKGFDPTSQDITIELGYPLVDVDRLNNFINSGKIEVVEGQHREI